MFPMWLKKISSIVCLLVGLCACLNVQTSAESAFLWIIQLIHKSSNMPGNQAYLIYFELD